MQIQYRLAQQQSAQLSSSFRSKISKTTDPVGQARGAAKDDHGYKEITKTTEKVINSTAVDADQPTIPKLR